jgi:uncharacterized protein (DUF1499 family)
MKRVVRILAVFAALVGAAIAYGQAVGFTGSPPTDIGVRGGRLAPCKTSPNCVTSYDHEGYSAIAPLKIDGDVATAMAKLKTAVGTLPRVTVVDANGGYLYVTQRSKLMGYVDDVEFLFDPGAGVVHVRSASRLGHSDMGVNRDRIERLRAALGG